MHMLSQTLRFYVKRARLWHDLISDDEFNTSFKAKHLKVFYQLKGMA